MRTARRRGRLATRMTRALALAGLVASASLTATGSTAGVADAACTFVQDQTINNTSNPPPDPLFGNLTSNGPYGVAADGAGNVHLVDPSSNAAYRFDAGGAQTLTIAGAASPAFTDPDGVAVDSAGNIYVGSPDPSASVQKFAPDGSHVATLLGTAFPADERFRNPRGIVVDDVTGTVYFVESGGGVVRVYAADTDLTNPVILIDKADPEPDFNGLGGLALDADHNVYVAGSSRNMLGDPYGIVYKFAPDGTQVIDGPWPLVDPAMLTFGLWGVDVDASGNVYVVDGGIGPSTSSPDPTAAVYGFSPSGDLFLTIDNASANAPDPAFITPRDVSVDDSGTQLHVTDIWSNTLYRFTADCGQPQDANIFVNAGEGYVQVGGFGWPGEHVTVTVDDPDTAAVELTFDPVTPENGQFGLEQHGIQASADWVVTATDGNITKTLVVVDFTIDRVDTSDGRVEGTASPFTVLELIANGPDPDAVVGVTANAAGAWDTVLPLPVAGGDLSAHYIDGDGDFMGYSYRWPSIGVMLSDDVEEDGTVPDILLSGGNWPPGAVVHVVVDDPADTYDREFDFDVTEWGELDHWALGETGIPNGVVGDGWTVTATTTFDGWTTTKTHDVATVRVNETDHVAGTASGVCPAGRPETWVGTVSGRWPGQGGSSMQVDCADGTWAFEWEVDQFDIPLVTVGLRDGDWDGTSFLSFQDRPQVYHDAATGTVTFIYWNGEDVEVLLDGAPLTTIPHPGEQWYRTTLEQHGVPSSDITPGATITFQTSTELKTMVVEPVTIDTIDQDGTAHGTAAADAEVMVGVANADRFGGPAEFEVTMADGHGNWSAQLPPEAFPLDFDHVVRATVLDYDDDANIAEFVPTPQIVVRPTDDVVVALGFQQGEMVTVTVDDDQDPDNGVLFAVDREIQDPRHAHLELYDEETGEDWDVVAGEVVTVSSESASATHVVTELTTSGADTDADVVTGRAAPARRST